MLQSFMAKFRIVSGSSFNMLATQPHTGHLEVAAVAETDHYPELDWHDARGWVIWYTVPRGGSV